MEVVFVYPPKDIIGFSQIETTRTLSSNEIDRAKSHRLLELCKKKSNKRNGLKNKYKKVKDTFREPQERF